MLSRISLGRLSAALCVTERQVAHRPLRFEALEDRCLMAQTVGLFRNTPEAFAGYTLFAPSTSTTTYLIDNQGNRVHSWQSAYPPMSAYLQPDGSLIRVGRLPGGPFSAAPGAAGVIQRFNWEGERTWQYTLSNADFRMHHDIEVLPNGNILAIAWERKSRAAAIAAGRNPALLPFGELWPDMIIEIQPTGSSGGNIVWEWHMWDHLVQNRDASKANFGSVPAHPELINVNFVSSGTGSGYPPTDWAHINAVDYNAELDQIILSPREFSEVWIIDHSTTTQQARGHSGGDSGMGGDILYRWGNPRTYSRGSLATQKMAYQHDAQWIDPGLPGAGNILVFDNGWLPPKGRYNSAVHEIVPPLKHQWYLNDRSDSSTTEVNIFDILNVPATWLPITGDWSGDGRDSAGWYDPAAGRFHLYNQTDGTATGEIVIVVTAAPPGARPITGDWNGDGVDTVGLYDPALCRWHLSNQVGGWGSLMVFDGAALAGVVPIAGDWDGDGDDTVGLYEAAIDRWHLNNESTAWDDQVVAFNTPQVPPAWKPLAGDWDGDGDDSIGLYDPTASKFYLNNRIDGSTADVALADVPTVPAGWQPLAGDWDGDGADSIGLNDPTYHFGQYDRPAGAAFGPALPIWQFVGSPPRNFFAPIISGVQRLPNGNTLITEGTKGNMFEVTRDKRIVWRYVNPVISSGPLRRDQAIPLSTIGIAGVKANLVFRADRYAPSFPGFAGRDLTPQGPIERPPAAAVAAADALFTAEGQGADSLLPRLLRRR